MSTEIMTDGWARAVREIVAGWPDSVEKDDPRKPESYWDYFERKRSSFHGTYALGIRDIPGVGGTRFLAITFDGSGSCTDTKIIAADEADRVARISMECDYADWADIVNGYDISKAMTYHKLPLRVGDAGTLLRFVYFVHELIVAITRVETDRSRKVPA